MIYWLLIGTVDFIFTVISYPLALFICLFVGKDYMLPKWLSWFQTKDALMNGKGTVIEDNGSLSGGDWNFYQSHKNSNRFLTALLWMWRNPIYGFSSTVSSLSIDGSEYRILGNPRTNNRAPSAMPGWYLIVPKRWKGALIFGGFEFYYVKPYAEHRCIRIRLGWKCGNAFFSKSKQIANCVHSFNPFMGYNN